MLPVYSYTSSLLSYTAMYTNAYTCLCRGIEFCTTRNTACFCIMLIQKPPHF